MALLEYANRTVPDVVAKAVQSAYNSDPLLKDLRSKNKVVRTGGTHVRIVRAKSRHSDIVEINGSNMSVPLNKIETLSAMTGDWAKYIKPIIIPHIDRDRMSDKAEVKRMVQDVSQAAVITAFNRILKQIYIGNQTELTGLGSLNGLKTGLTSSGFQNGALQPVVPASQTGTYLNETRTVDTALDDNNWYNQAIQHSGFGTNSLKFIEQAKITADTYADQGMVSLGILSIADHVSLGDEVKATGSAAQGLHYTVEDIEKGRSVPTVWVVNGIRMYANRYMTAALIGATGMAYLINPETLEWWVNANHDWKVEPFTDFLKTSGQDADVSFLISENQLAVTNLMANAAIFQSVP
jgi:hypothetical protein